MKRVNTAESNGLLKGSLVGAGTTGALVLLTEMTIIGGLFSGALIVPAAAYGGYKIAGWLKK